MTAQQRRLDFSSKRTPLQADQWTRALTNNHSWNAGRTRGLSMKMEKTA